MYKRFGIDFLVELIREAIAAGDGDLIRAELDGVSADSSYDENGWSLDVDEFGARSHRLIDGRLAKMDRGDQWERRVAASARSRFVFHPDHHKEDGLLPIDDEKARTRAQWAFALMMTFATMSARKAAAFDYRYHEDGKTVFAPEHIGSVLGPNDSFVGKGPDPDAIHEWPQQFVDLLDYEVGRFRDGTHPELQ